MYRRTGCGAPFPSFPSRRDAAATIILPGLRAPAPAGAFAPARRVVVRILCLCALVFGVSGAVAQSAQTVPQFTLGTSAVDSVPQTGTEFATEDNMGKFEEMDGYGMLRYLTADRFGSVEYEIVAPCYEEAVSLHTDYTSPEYLAFEKKLYEKTLRELGFEKLLPEERAPQKNMNKRKEKVEER